MRIAEIYKSVQGEGRHTGTTSVFIRTSGCNLRCWFCDTPYASWEPQGQDYALDEILAEAEEWDCRHAVITGGEPMLLAELIPLTAKLRERSWHVTIETAGTLYLPVACDLMSISPKLAGSGPNAGEHPHWARRHERDRYRPEVLARLLAEYDSQLKFVVDRPEEIAEIAAVVKRLGRAAEGRVWLMPQGQTVEELDERETWLAPLCQQVGWRYCPRRQIEWFGGARRT